MKKLTKIIAFACLALMQNLLLAQAPAVNDKPLDFQSFHEVIKFHNAYFDTLKDKKGKGYKPFKRAEYFWQNRLNFDGTYPNLLNMRNELSQWKRQNNSKNKSDRLQAAQIWKALGPFDSPDANDKGSGVGRVNVISFHPTKANIIWAGSSGGGVYQSTDGGSNWKGLDETVFASIGISEIAISKSNPDIMYVATGDANGPSGLGGYYSIGIMKSTNAGVSWDLQPIFGNVPTQAQYKIYKIIIHPTLPNTAYAATNIGVFKTINGGDTWSTISNEFCRDIVFATTDPAVLVGAFQIGNGSYKISKYSGTIWSVKANYSGCVRIRLATTIQDPTLIYGILVNASNGFNSFIRSQNAGETFQVILTSTSAPYNYLGNYVRTKVGGGQGSYDLAIEINPTNSSLVFIGGINTWKSTNGGTSFTAMTDFYQMENSGLPIIHADIHDIKVNPLNNKMYVGHDGGVSTSTNNGTSWVTTNKGLNNTEYTRMSISTQDESFVMGGAQDNGTSGVINNTWGSMTGGDGMDNAVNTSNSQIVYSSSQYGSLYKSTNGGITSSSYPIIHGNQAQIGNQLPNFTGENAYWCAPMALDPSNPSTVYVGHQSLWRSVDNGTNFSRVGTWPNNSNQTLMAIAVAASNAKYIYVAYSDFSYPNQYAKSYLKRSIDGGANWAQIYTNANSITSIAVHPTNHQRVFLSISGFNAGNKVIEINNTNATNISDNLPNIPVNCFRYQAGSQDRMFVGTDVGVFYKDNSTGNWQEMGTGLPNVVVNDLEISYLSGKLKVATYGRGIWEVPISDCNIATATVKATGGKIDANNITLCQGDSTTLELTTTNLNGLTIAWSNGAKTNKIVVKTSGNYNVKLSDFNGCVSTSESFVVTEVVVPQVTLNYDVNKSTICEGTDSVSIAVAGFNFKSYLWSNGETSKRINAKLAGKYSVICTTTNGDCLAYSATVTIVANPSPALPVITVENKVLIASESPSGKYVWFKDGVVITGATSKEFTPTSDGKYKVQVFSTNGCTNTSFELFFATSSVEIEIAQSNILISPNPSTGIFHIKVLKDNFQTNDKLNFSITDMKGSEIKNFKLDANNSEYTLDITQFSTGTYYLNVEINGYTILKKVIKN